MLSVLLNKTFLSLSLVNVCSAGNCYLECDNGNLQTSTCRCDCLEYWTGVKCGMLRRLVSLVGLSGQRGKWNEGRKEGNVLYNDTLNTFYLRLYGVGHMVEDHSDSSFIYTIPQTG